MAGGGTPQLDGKPGLWNTGNAVLAPVDTYRVIRDLDLVGVGLMERSDVTIAPSGIRADPARADIAEPGNLTGQGGMAADGRFDFRMLVRLDKAITGAGQSGQGLWVACSATSGRASARRCARHHHRAGHRRARYRYRQRARRQDRTARGH